MKLNLNFDGKTLLRDWWKQVKELFGTVEEAHNTLETALEAETDARENADSDHAAVVGSNTVRGHVALSNSVESESGVYAATAATPYAVKTAYDKAAKGVSDAAAVQSNLDSEVSARKSADDALTSRIAAEESTRKSETSSLKSRVTAVENKAHAHGNKNVLDTITADDVEKWNGIKEQVTQTQLDAAIAAEAAARAAADDEITGALESHTDYADELFFGVLDELKTLYSLLGVTVYDGGLFGMAQDGDTLDGGAFEDTELDGFDCGDFEPLTTTTTAVIDGGNY